MQTLDSPAVERSAPDFRILAESLPAVVWQAAPDGRATFFNQRWVDYTGLALEASRGDGWSAALHADDRERALRAWQRAVAEAGLFEAEVRLRRADGDYRWWQLRAVPSADAAGVITGWCGICTDVHELKLREVQASQQRQRLEASFESMRDAVFASDAHGEIMNVNAAFARFYRTPSKAACPRSLAEVRQIVDAYTPDGRLLEPDQWIIPRALRGESGTDVELHLHRRDTDERWIGIYNYAPVRDASGTVIGTIVVIRDITEQRREQEETRATLETLTLALDGGRLGAWSWDFRTRRLEGSDTCLGYLGLAPGSESSYERWVELVHPDDRHRVEAAIAHAAQTQTDLNVDYRVVWPDRSEHWIKSLARPVRAADGRVARIVGVIQDIDEHRAAEHALADAARLDAEHRRQVELLNFQLAKRALDAETAARARDALLGNVSHELLTPLHHITGGADILLLGARGDRETKWLSVIKPSAAELNARIAGLLQIAQLRAGALQLDFVAFSPAAVLDEVALMLSARAAEKGLTLEVDPATTLPGQVHGDPTRLAQALLNYVDNAIKFTERGTVTIGAAIAAQDHDGITLRFEVTDTGIGVGPALRERLFAPFVPGDDSVTRLHRGLGVGLASTRDLAMLMGGEVGVDSLPGGGSRFWFTARLN